MEEEVFSFARFKEDFQVSQEMEISIEGRGGSGEARSEM
jgi:hypothetical protein